MRKDFCTITSEDMPYYIKSGHILLNFEPISIYLKETQELLPQKFFVKYFGFPKYILTLSFSDDITEIFIPGKKKLPYDTNKVHCIDFCVLKKNQLFLLNLSKRYILYEDFQKPHFSF